VAKKTSGSNSDDSRKKASSPRTRPKPKAARPDPAAVLNALQAPQFDALHIPEPQLIFGDGKQEPDPKTGLALHRPYDWNLPGRKSSIRLGVIGTGPMVDAFSRWLDRCSRQVLPIRQRKEEGEIVEKAMDALAYPPFPGLSAVFDAEFIIGQNMTAELSAFEIKEVLNLPYFDQRVTRLVNIIAGKTKVLSEGMQAPDVIIVALPTEVRKQVTVPKHHRTRPDLRFSLGYALKQALDEDTALGQQQLFALSPEETTQVVALEEQRKEAEAEHGVFHHGLKAAVMPFGIPVQLAWQATLEGAPTVEDDATRAWNFWTGVYYKAGGIPWRVVGLDRGTCYVGVAFYRDLSDGTLRTSMAQAFSDRGEGIVLRSEPFKWDENERSKTPHMPANVASSLMSSVIEAYEGVHDGPPSRVVVHKWQRYWPEELQGLQQALQAAGIRSFDFVAFGDRDIRFFRAGTEPVIRGTQVALTPQNALLYTRGYVPFTSEYSGMRVPRPVEILEHHGSASLKRLCEEILALTKQDCNSAVFAQKEPITTAFSKDVGQILAEIKPGVQPRTLYRFYM
jgi:hypothetical protein